MNLLRHLRRSVRARLIGMILLVTVMVLLFAGTALLVHDLSVYRKSFAQDVSSEAGILALSTAPALAFDDRATARLHLSALRARHNVLVAAVYDAGGRLYESYSSGAGESAAASLPAGEPIRIQGERVVVQQRIEHNGEFLGTIHLVFRYDVRSRVIAYLRIFAVVIAFGVLLALALSYSLQASVTTPLAAIAQVARQVVEKRDYSLRVAARGDDEIGIVISGFNRMLDEVRAQTLALTSSNESLTTEIEQRRQSERVYRAIGESIDFGVWITDAEGRCTYASDSFLKLTGLSQEQCSSLGWTELLHPDDQEATLVAWNECVRGSVAWYREHRILGVDGQYHPVLAQGVPMRREDGSVYGWAGINLDISRLKLTEEALRQADRRKDEFLATLAHELRNPLAPIRHAAELLGIAAASEQQRQWSRDVIARQVSHMALLLDDLLDVSRITRGRLELRREFVRLGQIVNSAIETARPLIEARRHALDIHLPAGDDDVGLNVDPLRMSQALSNLLTNAAKYTEPGGRISLAATVGEDGLSLVVSDNGIGLGPGAASRIFEMFAQADGAAAHSQGGLGIGLALVRGLVMLHGGSVGATSPGPGLGSRFTIRLPAAAVISHAPVAGAGAESMSAAGRGCSVLVVDDNRDGADSLTTLLDALGHDTRVTYSGQGALEAAESFRPRVVVLDIGMPGMDGYEVARQLRQTEWGRQARLIALTGWGQKEDIDRTRAAGFDLHLTKPVDLQKLQAYLAGQGETAVG